MKSGNFQVLIIDDHPLIANAYQQAIERVIEARGENVSISILKDIPEVVSMLKNQVYFKSLDLIFLDISLPIGAEEKYLSGEDLGVMIRNLYPELKLVIATAFNDNYRIYNILKNVNPQGFLIKNDLTSQELIWAIETLLQNKPFYSNTVLQLLRRQVSSEIIIDSTDRRILYELSKGTRMKELPEITSMSKAGIERRKRNLKILFDVEEGADKELITKAKERGFI